MATQLLFLACFLAQDPNADALKELADQDRAVRTSAIRKLGENPKQITDETVSRLIEYARTELEARWASHDVTQVKKLPRPPQPQTSMLRVRGDPDKYLGEPFLVCGLLRPTDYYNYGYREREDEYYSFDLMQIDVDMQRLPMGGAVTVYADKHKAGMLFEMVTRSHERSITMPVLLVCTINPVLYEGSSSASLIEAVAWQFLSDDGAKWQNWAYESVGACFETLAKARRKAVPQLVELIWAPRPNGEKTDVLMRISALQSIASMGTTDIRSAQRLLRSNDASDAYGRKWAIDSYNLLAALLKQKSGRRRR